MRVLITGGEGFGGSHLAEHCLAMGDEVWVTTRQGGRCRNLLPFVDSITIRIGDISNPDFIREILKETRFDLLFHLAGVSFWPEGDKDPRRTFETNLLGSLYVLEAVRTLQPETRVMLASSAEIYGPVPAEKMPIVETMPFAPAHLFASAKAALELAALPFVTQHNLHVVFLRPFNHTGPRQRPDFVCSSFAQQIVRVEMGAEAVIHVGDLSPRRDFSDVRDIVRGYRLLGLKGEKGEAYNLASGRSTPIGEILNMLVKMARVVVEVRAEPERLRKKQVMDVRGSFQKAHACCGWRPEFPLDKTLRDLLNWYRDQKPARPT